MKFSLTEDGFEIHRNVLGEDQISQLRDETDGVVAAAGNACVRHLRARSALFDALSFSNVIISLLPPGLRPVRSILFDKTPDQNWPVAWHQDLTIAVAEERMVPGYGPWSLKEGLPHVQPPITLLQQMVTVRIHLDDTPATNGALRVIPGSHRPSGENADPVNGRENAVTCECRPGDVVLMSPLILHSSRRSLSPTRRRVIHLEYARETDLDSRLQWLER